jgi:hypothetical protein
MRRAGPAAPAAGEALPGVRGAGCGGAGETEGTTGSRSTGLLSSPRRGSTIEATTRSAPSRSNNALLRDSELILPSLIPDPGPEGKREQAGFDDDAQVFARAGAKHRQDVA